MCRPDTLAELGTKKLETYGRGVLAVVAEG